MLSRVLLTGAKGKSCRSQTGANRPQAGAEPPLAPCGGCVILPLLFPDFAAFWALCCPGLGAAWASQLLLVGV